MTPENPTSGANASEASSTPSESQLQTSQPDVPVDEGTTGNPEDAAPTESNPTDSSSVSDSEGVQAEAQSEGSQSDSEPTSPEVDHEGTGAGTEEPPAGDYDGEPDGTDNA